MLHLSEVLKHSQVTTIVGLSNGPKYRKTRHNAGSDLIEYLRKYSKTTFPKLLAMSEHAQINNSGYHMRNLKLRIDLSKCIIAYDDVTLDYGQYLISKPSKARGHNGIRSIITAYDTDDFISLRIGIKGSFDQLCDYVLALHQPTQLKVLYSMYDDICEVFNSHK